jgi:sialic acid synthase SpsE
MADLNEVEAALSILYRAGLSATDVTLLHCTTEYPAPFDEVNLLAMLTLKEAFGTSVGYSDHTMGSEVAVAAVALGASVIEKHFTLDRTLPGPDHLASIEPTELKAMVRQIRNTELALGDGVKKPTRAELRNRGIVRKSLHLTKAVEAGHVLEESDLTTKRPGDGISPMRLREVVGRKMKHALESGAKLGADDLEL